jgi:hypothetical protein
MTTNGWWAWVGTPIPVSETNDLGLATKEIRELKLLMDPRDTMIADRAFNTLKNKIDIITGWNRNKRTPEEISAWRKEETRIASENRGLNF